MRWAKVVLRRQDSELARRKCERAMVIWLMVHAEGALPPILDPLGYLPVPCLLIVHGALLVRLLLVS
jgi:hypothetical protein